MKLMALNETEVFANEGGGVTITQIDWEDQKQVVALHGDQVEIVMLELQKLLSENKFSMIVEEDAAE